MTKKSVDRDLQHLPNNKQILGQTLASKNPQSLQELVQQNHRELSPRSHQKQIQKQGHQELHLQSHWQEPLLGQYREALSERTMKTTSPKRAPERLQPSQIKMIPRQTMQKMVLTNLQEHHQQDQHNQQPQGSQSHLEKILGVFQGHPLRQVLPRMTPLPKPPQEVPQQNPMHHQK